MSDQRQGEPSHTDGQIAEVLNISRLPVFLFSFVPYHVETAIVLAGVVLLFIGSIPAALAVLKAPRTAREE